MSKINLAYKERRANRTTSKSYTGYLDRQLIAMEDNLKVVRQVLQCSHQQAAAIESIAFTLNEMYGTYLQRGV